MEQSAAAKLNPEGAAKAVEVSPALFFAGSFSFAITSILLTAVDLDLFTAIDKGAETVERLAKETSCSTRGLRILLDALTATGFLTKDGGCYLLTPTSAAYLSKQSRTYAGGMALHARMLRDGWDHLTEIVRTGAVPRAVESEEDRGEFFAQLVGSLYGLNTPAAEEVARQLWKGEPPSPCRVLDIGAGSAVWSLALAREVSHAQVTVADWPAVIEKATKQFVAQNNATDRYNYLIGDFHEVDFGESAFDVAYLGHICHSEGAENSRALIRRIHRALRQGGKLVIADLLPDERRSQATVPLLFGVNMLVNTDEGDVFTLGEYRQWLEADGFGDVRTVEVPSVSPVIVATKV